MQVEPETGRRCVCCRHPRGCSPSGMLSVRAEETQENFPAASPRAPGMEKGRKASLSPRTSTENAIASGPEGRAHLVLELGERGAELGVQLLQRAREQLEEIGILFRLQGYVFSVLLP